METGEVGRTAGKGRSAGLAVTVVAVIVGVVVGFGAGWFLRPPPSTAELVGAELTAERRAALAEAYPDQPYVGGQATPEHVWRILPNGDLEAIHFNAPTLTEATKIWYVVVGVHVLDACEKPADAGFTHFHKESSPNWDAGHGGAPGIEGYWLKHVAVSEFDMPWGHVLPGVDYNFMPTPIAGCPA